MGWMRLTAATLGLMLGVSSAQAATVTVLISGGFRAAYDQLAPQYEQSKGNACRSHGWQFSIREVHCGAGIAEYQRARSMWT